MPKFKRNSIVSEKNCDGGWIPYGRVNRFVSPNTVEVIFCTRDVRILTLDEIEDQSSYKGLWITRQKKPTKIDGEWVYEKDFVYMATLRKLKQMAAYYNKTVWKKYRKHTK